MNKINCKYCKIPFVPSRIDMVFCQSNCRHKYKNRKRTYENELKQKENDLENLRSEILEVKNQLAQYREEIKIEEEKEEQDMLKESAFNINYQKMMKLTSEQLFEIIYNEKIKLESDPGEIAYLKDHIRFGDIGFKKSVTNDYKARKTEIFELLKKRQIERALNWLGRSEEIQIKAYEERINNLTEQITSLEQKEIKMILPSKLIQRELKQYKDRKSRLEALQYNIPSTELGGGEVRSMNFNTYRLSGELGRFLGELDSNMVAFALTGDSGAGKSYFSYELAKLFLVNRKTVKYYSLEEGIGKLTRDKLDYYQIGNEMKITANGTIEDIEHDAEKYDVIIVDSFSKITKDQKEFDSLRHNYPTTLFIMIFQKTTSKTMRGGAGIKYDSSATINVKIEEGERIAIMEKGRYGTQNWIYSITEGRILSVGL